MVSMQKKSRARSSVLLAIAGLLVLPAIPAAQPAASDGSPKPWNADTSLEDRRKAADLDREGNQLLEQLRFRDAMARYQEALEYWNHPRIQYHLAIVRIELDEDPLATYDSVEQALRYDGAGLTDDEQERAREYKKLLRRQLAEVEVACDQDGVAVTVAGKAFMTGPGVKRALVAPGEHQITASKKGHLAVKQTIVLFPREKKRIELKLFTLADVSGTRRYWKQQTPWTVVGTGATAAALGGLLHWRAKRNIDLHDQLLLTRHECMQGCKPGDPGSPASVLDRGKTQQTLAITSYVVGGAALLTGLTLVVLNQPRGYRIDRSEESFRVHVVPSVSPGGSSAPGALGMIGATATLSF